MVYFLFTYEKNKSPKNKEEAIKKHSRILNLKKYRKIQLIKKDDNVPDQVLFGLILGTINGPLSDFPTMYAIISFKKEMNIKINIKFSSKLLS